MSQLPARGGTLSIYRAGSDAFRDTAKWLIAFVPIASLTSVGALVGPRLIKGAEASTSPAGWLASNIWPILGVAAAAAGVTAIVFFGAKVLAAQPSEFANLLTVDRSKLSAAFSAGVGAPYFLDDSDFRTAMAELDVAWSAAQQAPEPTLARVVAATDMLRDWSLHNSLTEAFATFWRAFAAGVFFIVLGVLVAVSTLEPQAPEIRTPMEVRVEVQGLGASDLRSRTGCSRPSDAVFVAIAGTWDSPVLAVDGPDCRFGAVWRPPKDLFEMRPRRRS